MELSEIREKIDAVDDQLLDLFLQRMDLSEEVAAYKNEHHLPILNKERERAILAKVTEKSGEKERYAYHLFSTLFELARSRQAELIAAPTQCGRPDQGRPGGHATRCSPRRAWWPARAWRAPTPRWPATGCCPGATSSMSRPSRRWCPPWSRACASSACCPSRTAPTAPSGRCMSCSRTTTCPSSAPPGCASATSCWPCPA